MINKRHLLVIATMLGGFLISGGVFAVEGDPKVGKGKASMCTSCHGGDGNSPTATYPRLAGQYEDYIVKQVMDFKEGRRTNNSTMTGMAGMVASLKDAHDIAAYFSEQKMADEPIAEPNSKLVRQGKELFNNGNPKSGVYACVKCHGKNGKGKAESISVFPVIGGQHRDYIIKQLKNFRDGERTNDPAGMMADIAKKLTDQEIKAVANYLSTR